MKWLALAQRLAFAAAILCAQPAFAGPAPQSVSPPSIPLKLPGASDTTTWTIVIVLTLLTILPRLLLSMTPFVRILIVFHFLRQALATQTSPSNQTLAGLALFLTYFIMQPVGADIERVAISPLERHELTGMQALD